MKPLSPLRRRLYLLALFALFCIVVPASLLYASGWRYKAGFGFVRTGGIFVSVPYDGASVSLDGKPVGESGFLNHRLYLSDLAPSAYTVKVEAAGMQMWEKVLVVEPALVTDAQALLIPQTIQPERLVVGAAATGTAAVSADELAAIRAAFAESFASSTAEYLVQGGMTVGVVEGDVLVRWTDPSQRTPSVFCGRPSYCAQTISVERSPETAFAAAFFGGGVVYATREGGVAFSEADLRPTVVSAPLYPKAGAIFRIVGGQLIVKDGGNFYLISL